MIDCDEMMEREGLRKFVNMRRGLKPEKSRRKKNRGVKLFIAYASLHR